MQNGAKLLVCLDGRRMRVGGKGVTSEGIGQSWKCARNQKASLKRTDRRAASLQIIAHTLLRTNAHIHLELVRRKILFVILTVGKLKIVEMHYAQTRDGITR